MSDEGLKFLGTILGPTLAALLTGGALLYQNAVNARREERQAVEQRREEHARAAAGARTEWAAAFQEALVTALNSVNAWKLALDPILANRAFGAYDSWLSAFGRAQVATARLLMVEQDPWIRVTASALASAAEPTARVEGEGDRSSAAKVESDRLSNLYGAFLSFTKLASGTGTPEDVEKLVRDFEKACSKIPPETRATLIAKMSRKAALGS